MDWKKLGKKLIFPPIWAMMLLSVMCGTALIAIFVKGFDYQGVLIYVMAAFTFYITTHAIINLIKYRRYNSPVMIMTKVIALSSALVSMLALETAMFSQFGAEMKPDAQRLMIALTGAGVSIIVVTMSIYIIVKSVKEIRNIKEKINE